MVSMDFTYEEGSIHGSEHSGPGPTSMPTITTLTFVK